MQVAGRESCASLQNLTTRTPRPPMNSASERPIAALARAEGAAATDVYKWRDDDPCVAVADSENTLSLSATSIEAWRGGVEVEA